LAQACAVCHSPSFDCHHRPRAQHYQSDQGAESHASSVTQLEVIMALAHTIMRVGRVVFACKEATLGVLGALDISLSLVGDIFYLVSIILCLVGVRICAVLGARLEVSTTLPHAVGLTLGVCPPGALADAFMALSSASAICGLLLLLLLLKADRHSGGSCRRRPRQRGYPQERSVARPREEGHPKQAQNNSNGAPVPAAVARGPSWG